MIHQACAHPGVQALIFTGGTGIAPRDQTFEAIDALLEKAAAGLRRAVPAGSPTRRSGRPRCSPAPRPACAPARAVFSLPGSPAACRLAVERLILPELSHIVGLLGR